MNIGDMIPSDLGIDAEGHMVKESDFKGKPLIIYFYPKDNTWDAPQKHALCATDMPTCAMPDMK